MIWAQSASAGIGSIANAPFPWVLAIAVFAAVGSSLAAGTLVDTPAVEKEKPWH